MHKFYTELQVGDEFFEYGYGDTLHLVVTDPTRTIVIEHGDTQYVWRAKILSTNDEVTSTEEIDYLITEGYEHYGPKIYQ